MQLIYEGKAKKIFSADNPNEVIMHSCVRDDLPQALSPLICRHQFA